MGTLMISIANFKKTFTLDPKYHEDLKGELVKGVDTKISLNFNEIDSRAIIISKAIINSVIKGTRSNGESQYFSFRNIKILLN